MKVKSGLKVKVKVLLVRVVMSEIGRWKLRSGGVRFVVVVHSLGCGRLEGVVLRL